MAITLLRQVLAAAAVVLYLSVWSGGLSAQDTRQMVTVAKDVYTMTGAGSNASFVVTDEGVLVFDSDIRNNDLPFIRKAVSYTHLTLPTILRV